MFKVKLERYMFEAFYRLCFALKVIVWVQYDYIKIIESFVGVALFQIVCQFLTILNFIKTKPNAFCKDIIDRNLVF